MLMVEKRVFDTAEAMVYTGFKNRNKFFTHIKVGNLKPLPDSENAYKFDIRDLDIFIDNLKAGTLKSISE